MTQAVASPLAEAATPPVTSAAEAHALVFHLAETMATLLQTLERETAMVRAGKLADAAQLEQDKTELARQYTLASKRLKANQDFLARTDPGQFATLQRKHDEFHALLQINLAVLATAHAVSEGIMRGVADELARKSNPQAYGASGRAAAPGPAHTQPMAISRVL